jgi:hypothetical protein
LINNRLKNLHLLLTSSCKPFGHGWTGANGVDGTSIFRGKFLGPTLTVNKTSSSQGLNLFTHQHLVKESTIPFVPA